jgi:exodeoxyribonuclease V beta subunit
LAPRVYAAAFERDWAVGSYSALVRDAARETAAAGEVPARIVRDDEPEAASVPATGPGLVASAPVACAATELPWHRFPRGAAAGNFLHEQLEWLADEGFALADSAELQRALVRRSERRGFGQQAADVSAWLARVCATPLPPVGVALTALAGLVPEMEFWLACERIDARRIDELCRRHLLPGRDRPRLPERALKGMLLGFADLVFEHAGRYWVLDYKSNALGVRDADYTIDAMDAAILEHRYDVQAALYLLALHRLLRSRLRSAYEPQRHLGGAVYLFLRGIAGAAAGCRHLEAPAALLDELDAMLRDGDAGRDGRTDRGRDGTGAAR